MPDTPDDAAEVLRKFESAISGMEMADLRELTGLVMELAGGTPDPQPEARPSLRRPPMSDPVVLRLRVDLDHSTPPIWRRLDVRGDLTLDVVHQVLQSAFSWTDSHLHRFSLGGGPFDRAAELFLCPFDVDEGEDDGDPASSVRLDETVQQPGDVLRYLYDYGDSWELTLRVEEVLPAEPGTPMGVCVDGRRAAPPEDCGSLRTADELAEVLDDPSAFDLDAINRSLRDPFFVAREAGVAAPLVDLVNRLSWTAVGDDLASRMLGVCTPVSVPTEAELAEGLAAHWWFLDRVRGGGIELTASGYLKPADVTAAAAVVPAMAGWIGKNNRESLAGPLLDFRQSLQAMGLLRKYKGRLLATRAGAAAQRDPVRLWEHLITKSVPAGRPGEYAFEGTWLLLLYAATADGPLPLDRWAAAMGQLGWRFSDGRPVEYWAAYQLPAFEVLKNIGPMPREGDRFEKARISGLASVFAAAVCRAC